MSCGWCSGRSATFGALQGPLAEETHCCEERIAVYSRPRQYGETRPLRVRYPADHAGVSAAISSAVSSRAEDCYEPENDCYASRDPWYTQSQSNRLCLDAVRGNQMAVPMVIPVMSTTAAPVDPPYSNHDL